MIRLKAAGKLEKEVCPVANDLSPWRREKVASIMNNL